jgi:hypothetical protein
MRALRRIVSDSKRKVTKSGVAREFLAPPVPPIKPHDGGVVDEKNSTARPEKNYENECTFSIQKT